MAAQNDHLSMDAQPQLPESSAQNEPSTSCPPQYNPFRRAYGSFSGGTVLARLTSSTSLRVHHPNTTNSSSIDSNTQPRPSIGHRISSRSRKSAEGAHLAELSKPNGKFQSGIKWDSQQTPEPWMEASHSTALTAEERELGKELQEQAALASGSTAAAQAHANASGLGTFIFGNANKGADSSRSGSPKSLDARLPTVSQTISPIGSSGIHPEILAGISSSNTSTMQFDSPKPVESTVEPSGMTSSEEAILSGDDGATPSLTPPPAKSREPSQSEQGGITGDNHMVARAAQLVLEAARQQARVETRRKGKSAPASPKRIGASLSPISTSTAADQPAAQQAPTVETTDQLERTPSQRARSKSDAGNETQVKRRKSFLRSMSSRSRRNKSDANGNASEDGSETPTPSSNSPANASGMSSGTVTLGGRRRRYVDTRDLDLLARELAAEAIAEQIPQPPFARPQSGSSSPLRSKAGVAAYNDPRRRSFPSILEDAPLQDDGITLAPTMSGNGLKQMTPLHDGLSNGRTRRADMAGVGSAGKPDDPTNGMVPKEMFLGLGGSPYPSIPPPAPAMRASGNALDTMDPFGIPITQQPSPFDATMAYANKTHVYHTPNQVAVSRSLSGASTWSASQTSPNGSTKQRRPVLTMTMNDPQAELQGLTKPPKEPKKLTPFGSRASSRAPSPSPSFTNLKKEAARQEAQAEGGKVADEAKEEKDGLKVEAEDVKASSRRNSLAASETSVRPGLASVKSSKKNRLSTMFSRSNKSKTQIETLSRIQAASKATSATNSPELSVYATPASVAPAAMSPQSAAISADSDADISPIAFRTVDLPPTTQNSRPTNSSNFGGSTDASRPSSVAPQDSIESKAAAPKKRPIRALLRRLSSFSGDSAKAEAKKAARKNSAKANSPDVTTMPVVDMDTIKQLSENPNSTLEDIKIGDDKVEVAKPDVETVEAEGLASRLEGLDLSKASPVPVNEEMSKNGFGTRSAYKLSSSTSNPNTDTKQAKPTTVAEDVVDTAPTSTATKVAATESSNTSTEEEAEPQIGRTDSQTLSSEDSFFLGASSSRPGSGAGGLMKHGSESAISEELHTPDPSTAHLPASMAGLGGKKDVHLVVTSIPTDAEQPVALV
ncbi:uncharacterized protein UHOD_06428 [Ustilago sp. UG-2017b]|nr:uncharacterized protein UHOD_06428 [Ustilago sp. UG-2017b]